jgi:putative endonuclease
MPFVHILQCADGSFYVGRTNDLRVRLEEHQSGVGAGFTARRRPVEMVHAEEFAQDGAAANRKHQLKKWSRAKKSSLIKGHRSLLKVL